MNHCVRPHGGPSPDFKCGTLHVRYKCGAVISFSFTFGCLTAPFYGRPTKYCGKWDGTPKFVGSYQRKSLKTSALQEPQGSSDIEENKDRLSLTNPRDALHHGELAANK